MENTHLDNFILYGRSYLIGHEMLIPKVLILRKILGLVTEFSQVNDPGTKSVFQVSQRI